jgi:hypothetical protein
VLFRLACAPRSPAAISGDDFVAERDEPPLLVQKAGRAHVSPEVRASSSPRRDRLGNAQGGYGDTRARLITVGDSFTWCHHVAPGETWTHRLCALVGRRTTWRVVGPYEYVQLLRASAWRSCRRPWW